jgi:dihydroorotase
MFTPQGTSEIKKENLRSTSKNSMFIGQKGKGSVYGVIVNNQLILA